MRLALVVALIAATQAANINVNIIPTSLTRLLTTTYFNSTTVTNIQLPTECDSQFLSQACASTEDRLWKSKLSDSSAGSRFDLPAGTYNISVADILACYTVATPDVCDYSDRTLKVQYLSTVPAALEAASMANINILIDDEAGCDCTEFTAAPSVSLSRVSVDATAAYALFEFSGDLYLGNQTRGETFELASNSFTYTGATGTNGTANFLSVLGSGPYQAIWMSSKDLAVAVKPDHQLASLRTKGGIFYAGLLTGNPNITVAPTQAVDVTINVNPDAPFAHPRNYPKSPLSTDGANFFFTPTNPEVVSPANYAPWYPPAAAVAPSFYPPFAAGSLITTVGNATLASPYELPVPEQVVQLQVSCAGVLTLDFSSTYATPTLAARAYRVSLNGVNRSEVLPQLASNFPFAQAFVSSTRVPVIGLVDTIFFGQPSTSRFEYLYAVCNWFPVFGSSSYLTNTTGNGEASTWETCSYIRVVATYAPICIPTTLAPTPAGTLAPTTAGFTYAPTIAPTPVPNNASICLRQPGICNSGQCRSGSATNAYTCCCRVGSSGTNCNEPYVFNPETPPCGQVYYKLNMTLLIPPNVNISDAVGALGGLIANVVRSKAASLTTQGGEIRIAYRLLGIVGATPARRLLAPGDQQIAADATVPIDNSQKNNFESNVQNSITASDFQAGLPAGWTAESVSTFSAAEANELDTQGCQIEWTLGCTFDTAHIVGQPGPSCTENCVCPAEGSTRPATNPPAGCSDPSESDSTDLKPWKIAVGIVAALLGLLLLLGLIALLWLCCCRRRRVKEQPVTEMATYPAYQPAGAIPAHAYDVGPPPDLDFPAAQGPPPLLFPAEPPVEYAAPGAYVPSQEQKMYMQA
jgi:hypothetical protein